MDRRIIIFLMLLFVSLNGCKTTRLNVGSGHLDIIGNIEEIKENLAKNDCEFKNIWIKRYNCEIRDNFKRQKFYGDIKIVKGEKIIITVKSGVGMESGRMLVNRDSIIFVDRIHKEILKGSYGSWKNYFKLLEHYERAENILLGDNNLAFDILDDNSTKEKEMVKMEKNRLIINELNYGKYQGRKIILNNEEYKITEFLQQNLNSDKIRVNYLRWDEIRGRKIPKKIDVEIRINSNERRAILEYERMELNSEMNEIFKMPVGYKVIKL